MCGSKRSTCFFEMCKVVTSVQQRECPLNTFIKKEVTAFITRGRLFSHPLLSLVEKFIPLYIGNYVTAVDVCSLLCAYFNDAAS